MTAGFCFSGIGGFELACIIAGIKLVWSNEIDPYCCKLLRQNFSHKIIEDDIRNVKGEQLESVDIICGGFPCQPFSHAGQRKGKKDDRYLWPEMLRIVREKRPAVFIGENVAGLASMENGSSFEEWIFLGMESKNYLRKIYSRYIYRQRQTFVLDGIIANLEKEDYTVETFIIPAASVGAWHRRNRVWIVAYSNSHRLQGYANEKEHTEIIGERKEKRNRFTTLGEKQNSTEIIANSKSFGTEGNRTSWKQESQGSFEPTIFGSNYSGDGAEIWSAEPGLDRMVHGVPNRVDRIKGLGNAIVPQVAVEILKAIKQLYQSN